MTLQRAALPANLRSTLVVLLLWVLAGCSDDSQPQSKDTGPHGSDGPTQTRDAGDAGSPDTQMDGSPAQTRPFSLSFVHAEAYDASSPQKLVGLGREAEFALSQMADAWTGRLSGSWAADPRLDLRWLDWNTLLIQQDRVAQVAGQAVDLLGQVDYWVLFEAQEASPGCTLSLELKDAQNQLVDSASESGAAATPRACVRQALEKLAPWLADLLVQENRLEAAP